MVDKPGTMVPLDANCHLAETPEALKYVSRGGLKLEKALDTFHLSPAGLVALDVGASTGGFTQVLLERGAKRVYAVDVGYGQLAWTLRNDPRVVVMEHTNIRHLTSLPEPIQCVAIDVSFISLRLVLPAVVPLLAQLPSPQPVSLHFTTAQPACGSKLTPRNCCLRPCCTYSSLDRRPRQTPIRGRQGRGRSRLRRDYRSRRSCPHSARTLSNGFPSTPPYTSSASPNHQSLAVKAIANSCSIWDYNLLLIAKLLPVRYHGKAI